MIAFMIVWTGGYEDNQYSELKTDLENALAEARNWIGEARENEQVDILQIDTDDLTVERIGSYWLNEHGDVMIGAQKFD